MHHIFGPHFFGPPLLPGIPNLILFILLALAVWYFLGKRNEPAEGPKELGEARDFKDPLEKKNEELKAEVSRLRRENELLQKILEKELKKP